MRHSLLSILLQEQIDELVENKILEALCGSQITESTKVSTVSSQNCSSSSSALVVLHTQQYLLQCMYGGPCLPLSVKHCHSVLPAQHISILVSAY